MLPLSPSNSIKILIRQRVKGLPSFPIPRICPSPLGVIDFFAWREPVHYVAYLLGFLKKKEGGKPCAILHVNKKLRAACSTSGTMPMFALSLSLPCSTHCQHFHRSSSKLLLYLIGLKRLTLLVLLRLGSRFSLVAAVPCRLRGKNGESKQSKLCF